MSVDRKQKSGNSAMKRKSIRLQIDLPLEDSDTDSEQIGQHFTPINKIHLRISIDKSSIKKLKNSTSKARKQINFSDKSTSGYSSSSASSSLIDSVHEYSFLNDCEENAFLEHDDSGFKVSSLKRKRASNENLYDRLVHSNTKSRVTSSIYRSNDFLSSSTYDFLTENNTDTDDNIYEEISNFIETNPKCRKLMVPTSHSYENVDNVKNDVKRVYYNERVQVGQENSANKFCYKREYTVNEIFDNLKKFKKQAKEQEILSTSAKKCANTYENNRISKPIYV